KQKIKINVQKGLLDSMKIEGEVDYASKKNNLKLFAKLPATELRVFEPYLSGVVSKMKGWIKTKDSLKITGTFKNPVVSGQLQIREAELLVDYLNVPISFDVDIESSKDFISFGPIT